MEVEQFRRLQAVGAGRTRGCRYAHSIFRRHQVFLDRLTLVRVVLKTGRTHQIRVHAADLGLPIIGDLVYHRPAQLPASFPEQVRTEVGKVRRQMLHACILGIEHPVSGRRMVFEAPYPPDFQNILSLLANIR